MKFKKIQIIEYEYGFEKPLISVLNKSKEPILIKIKKFPNKFDIDYFIERVSGKVTYDYFENDLWVGQKTDDFKTVAKQIKANMPYRIFGLVPPRSTFKNLESYVPLWQKIPFRPRFFIKRLKVAYFLGGKNSHTEMHFDREHCCNLHLCISGKKEILLFTEDQSDYMYKVPFIGDSLIDFGLPFEVLKKSFPRLENALGYKVQLETGDMLFLPRNCWHYTSYLEASVSATYVFYPRKFFQLYGFFTGLFFLGYKGAIFFQLCKLSIFEKFSNTYAFASGKKKVLLKALEKILYCFLLPTVSISFLITNYIKKRQQ